MNKKIIKIMISIVFALCIINIKSKVWAYECKEGTFIYDCSEQGMKDIIDRRESEGLYAPYVFENSQIMLMSSGGDEAQNVRSGSYNESALGTASISESNTEIAGETRDIADMTEDTKRAADDLRHVVERFKI